VLAKVQNAKSKRPQRPILSSVTTPVAVNFAQPPLTGVAGDDEAARASVPEASIDENGDGSSDQDEIWSPG
jgi:hypothetical protein